MIMRTFVKTFLFIIISMFAITAHAKIFNIVAAENFYGDIAKQIGGPYVVVSSILNNPNQDPHLFSASPSTARLIANADIIVYNGAAYDAWMERLLSANTGSPSKPTIVIADLIHKTTTANPHLWYDPATMPAYAEALTAMLIQQDPTQRDFYQQRLQLFKQHYQTLLTKIAQLKQHYNGAPISATEPLFNYMADAIGLNMHDQSFQIKIMNDAVPSATEISDFEKNLRTHQVRALLYNNQVSDPVTQRMQLIAQQAGIPIVGVSETQPPDKDFVAWMMSQLDALDKALQKNKDQH